MRLRYNNNKSIYGLEMQAHGGGCCGMMHLYSFVDVKGWGVDLAWRKEMINKAIDNGIEENYDFCTDEDCDCDSPKSVDGWNCLVEVAIIGSQKEEWGEALEAVGFRCVQEFVNSNTGNTVYVYLCESNSRNQ